MSTDNDKTALSRRSFLAQAGVAGAGLVGAALIAGCGGSSSSATSSSSDNQIVDILITAEALAVTTYTNIISSGIYTSLASNPDLQAYFVAAQAQEQIHLTQLDQVVGAGNPTVSFYYPVGMFTSPQVTLNTLVALEELTIAAYLVGVGQFSTSALRVLAARILGVESDHRTLARVAAASLGLTEVTGYSTQPSSVKPANNLGFEQTFLLQSISYVQTDFLPYTTASSAASATPPFGTTAYPFVAVNVAGSPYNNFDS